MYPSTFLHSLVPWFTGGVALAPSSHSQHLCLGHTSSHAWLLVCSCLATTTTTMAINTLALHCTAFHMTPFIGMHGWVHVCKCLLCPDGWKKLNRFVSPCLDLGQADLPPSRMLAVAMLQLIHHLCHLAQNPVAAEFPSAGPETAIDSSFTHCLPELPLL